VQYWNTLTNYDYRITVKICINGGSYDVHPSTAFCIYEEQSYYPFTAEDRKLIFKNEDYSFLDVQFDAKVLAEQTEKITAAANAYEAEAEKVDYRFRNVLRIQRLTN
jgi:hypothetical protein